MVVFVSAGLFIAFSTHICSLSMILFTKYVLFLIISLGIHSGAEGCSGDKKLIIDMSHIFDLVMKNAIQIH